MNKGTRVTTKRTYKDRGRTTWKSHDSKQHTRGTTDIDLKKGRKGRRVSTHLKFSRKEDCIEHDVRGLRRYVLITPYGSGKHV